MKKHWWMVTFVRHDSYLDLSERTITERMVLESNETPLDWVVNYNQKKTTESVALINFWELKE